MLCIGDCAFKVQDLRSGYGPLATSSFMGSCKVRSCIGHRFSAVLMFAEHRTSEESAFTRIWYVSSEHLGIPDCTALFGMDMKDATIMD
ncbi:hypothetical protein BHYA_0137g00200 [Botrytis hyacinthi]|uniref:Uncharacterized protein n=1 Tax=Botrytis hyacinthi TaxID=278943 RepID=A0A4Z1GL84_9HELO|nr:hypothetical protein BHYA_0137g00200 [Botrytis hyacinthi]